MFTVRPQGTIFIGNGNLYLERCMKTVVDCCFITAVPVDHHLTLDYLSSLVFLSWFSHVASGDVSGLYCLSVGAVRALSDGEKKIVIKMELPPGIDGIHSPTCLSVTPAKKNPHFD